MTEGEPCDFTVAFFDLIVDPVDGKIEGETLLPCSSPRRIEQRLGPL